MPSVLRFLKFGTRVGVLAGTIYYTTEIGIWNDGSKTEEVYKNIYNFVAPYVKEIPVEVPEIPKAEDITRATRKYWNQGVVGTAEFLANIPDNAVALSEKGYIYLKSVLDSSVEKK